MDIDTNLPVNVNPADNVDMLGENGGDATRSPRSLVANDEFDPGGQTARTANDPDRAFLFNGYGGTGGKVAVHGIAWAKRIFGGLPPSTRVMHFDADPSRPVVRLKRRQGNEVVSLEPDVESIPLARGRSPIREAREARREPDAHRDLLRVLALQRDGRVPTSFERGAENERGVGYAAWLLSLRDTVRPALRSAVHTVTRRGGSPSAGRGIAPTVIVAASMMGGMGSAAILPGLAAILEALEEATIDSSAATIIELLVLPEALERTPLRDANTAATILDHNAASQARILPGIGPDTEHRDPDLVLVCGTTNARSMKLDGGADELADILGLAVVLLGACPIREQAAAVLANVQRRRARRTVSGSPMSWGSIGVTAYHFDAASVAELFAQQLVHIFVESRPAETAIDQADAVGAMFATHGVGDVEQVMRAILGGYDGQPRIGDLADEFLEAFHATRGKASSKITRVEDVERTAEARISEALASIAGQAKTLAAEILRDVDRQVRDAVGGAGVHVADGIVRAVVDRIDDLLNTLAADRAYVAEGLAGAEERRLQLFALLKERAEGGFWARRDLDREAVAYLTTSASTFTDHYLHGAPEPLIAALAGLRQDVDVLGRRVRALADNLKVISADCDKSVRGFLAYRPASLLEQHLYDEGELEALFEEHVRSRWEHLSEDVRRSVLARSAPSATWIDLDAQALRSTLITAALGITARVRDITADDFLTWALKRRALLPEVFLRDVFVQAAPLWRIDESRVPDDSGLAETTFKLIGVPDARRSPLRTSEGVTLVSTGNPEYVFALQIVVGLPAEALWRWPAYRRSYDEIQRRGDVVLHPYPDLNNPSPATRRRPGPKEK